MGKSKQNPIINTQKISIWNFLSFFFLLLFESICWLKAHHFKGTVNNNRRPHYHTICDCRVKCCATDWRRNISGVFNSMRRKISCCLKEQKRAAEYWSIFKVVNMKYQPEYQAKKGLKKKNKLKTGKKK